MKQVCSKCGVVYGVKQPIEDTSITHGFCPECLREQEIELVVFDLLKTGLKLNIVHWENRIEIQLLLNNNIISKDFIDYTEVVRVVNRENEGSLH